MLSIFTRTLFNIVEQSTLIFDIISSQILLKKKVVTLEHVDTEEQLEDIFTKALDAKQFEKLRGKLGICLHEEA